MDHWSSLKTAACCKPHTPSKKPPTTRIILSSGKEVIDPPLLPGITGALAKVWRKLGVHKKQLPLSVKQTRYLKKDAMSILGSHRIYASSQLPAVSQIPWEDLCSVWKCWHFSNISGAVLALGLYPTGILHAGLAQSVTKIRHPGDWLNTANWKRIL